MIAVLLFAACGTDPTPAAVSNPASSAASNVESGPVARPAEVMERGRQNSAVPVGSTDLRPVPASRPDGMAYSSRDRKRRATRQVLVAVAASGAVYPEGRAAARAIF